MSQQLLGHLAKSRAGRDKGRWMIIIEVIDSQYVYVVDGKLRKVESPKKKKLKHLKLSNQKVESITEKLRDNEKLSNEEVRKALNKMVNLVPN